jgi:uncharacterized membrane protein
MSQLIVLTFPTETGAQQALSTVGSLQKQNLIALDDAATVTRGQDGKPKVKQATSLVGAGTLGGAFWGMLIGLLFFMPWLGLAVGAVTGALAAKFSDIGIDDNFIKEVGQKIQPGMSALFMLVRSATADKVIDALRPLNPEVAQTSLSTEQEQKLREAFSGNTESEAAATPEAAAGSPAAEPAQPTGAAVA